MGSLDGFGTDVCDHILMLLLSSTKGVLCTSQWMLASTTPLKGNALMKNFSSSDT